MADTGYNWSGWTKMPITDGGDGLWDGDALADNGTATSDALDVGTIASLSIGVLLVEDNTGAIDGVVTVYVLGEFAHISYEEPGVGSPYSFTITPVQNDSVMKRFTIDASVYEEIKIAIKNESGQELAVSVNYQSTSIPLAS